jgi:hypothetical protein
MFCIVFSSIIDRLAENFREKWDQEKKMIDWEKA